MEQVYLHKQNKLTSLTKLNNKYLSLVFKGLVENKPIREIHRDIKKLTNYRRTNNLDYDKNVENYAMKLAIKTKNQVNVNKIEKGNVDGLDLGVLIADKVYDYFKKEDSYKKMKKIVYDNVRKTESKEKEQAIFNEIEQNRREIALNESIKAKIFYLCSSHNDCADDHKDWQGKMYYDNEWHKYIKDEDIRKKIQSYLTNHNCKSFQWVTGRPVWLITRPNCRHYFKVLRVEQVLGRNEETLVRNHKMHTGIGKKGMQTINHSTRRDWYTEDNILNIIEKYKERLAYHQSLYAVKKTPTIKNAIEKDNFLIKKWEKYLQTKFD